MADSDLSKTLVPMWSLIREDEKPVIVSSRSFSLIADFVDLVIEGSTLS
jgi:hypothetical protein